jgi:hypothetical protein
MFFWAVVLVLIVIFLLLVRIFHSWDFLAGFLTGAVTLAILILALFLLWGLDV